MDLSLIPTPAILLDLDILEANIKKAQALCQQYGKELWPMVKTHKSSQIAKMQKEAGATGFLSGTLDEAEALAQAGIDKIMYAYPVASPANICRVLALAKKSSLICRIDHGENARLLNDAATLAKSKIGYTIIIDSGLGRFGVAPQDVVAFANYLKDFKALNFLGISTHPGQVYLAQGPGDLAPYVQEERQSMALASKKLRAAGYQVQLVTSGSTPTFYQALDDENIGIYHPGNYVFMDNIQRSTGTARIDDCALTVLATVISRPGKNRFICDAGAKTLGLDQGTHSGTSIKAYGFVKGHQEIAVRSLSEEVGQLEALGPTSLQVGDQIEIIPNHSCSTANLTSYFLGHRQGKIEKHLRVDMRGNSLKKLPI